MKVNKETLNSGVKVFVCSRMLNSTEVMMMIHPAPLHHSAHKVYCQCPAAAPGQRSLPADNLRGFIYLTLINTLNVKMSCDLVEKT